MGLFSKKKRFVATVDLSHNAAEIRDEQSKLVEQMYSTKEDLGAKVFETYAIKMLNLEVLSLANGRAGDSDYYSYHKGRIDALRELLGGRTKRLEDLHHQRTKESKNKADHRSKRNYVTRPSTSGLA